MAALASFLFARQAGGRWLVRIEDLDRARVVPGSEAEILTALDRHGLAWDGDIVRQSEREELYRAALDALDRDGQIYACACSRAEVRRAASAPDPDDAEGEGYPGTCRAGLPPGRPPRALRFRAPAGTVAFEDRVVGAVRADPARGGDFVVRRADGPFAYQLAVVVDDALQGVTEVVRGGDLLASTPRQIALQRALGYAQPQYGHVPVVVGPDGKKLGKRHGSLSLADRGHDRLLAALRRALRVLGQDPPPGETPSALVGRAVAAFEPTRIPTLRTIRMPD